MADLKINDRVMISHTSIYETQGYAGSKQMIGTIIEVRENSTYFKYYVKWESGSKNSYGREDLVYVSSDEPTNKRLETFPTEGHVITKDVDFINHLKSTHRQSDSSNPSIFRGVGWNVTSFWYFVGSSSKTEYTVQQLKHFYEPIPAVKNEPHISYVKCINDNHSYPAHPEAFKYGVRHYANTSTTNGHVYRLVKSFMMNIGTIHASNAYVLYRDGKEYLIDEVGVTVSSKEEYDAQFADEEYEKCIKEYTGKGEVGKIYKRVKEDQLHYDGKYVFLCSQNEYKRKEWLVPSTKEEYQAQFKQEKQFKTIKTEEHEHKTSKISGSIKVCKSNFKISEGIGARGLGLKSSGSKIKLGNNNRNY